MHNRSKVALFLGFTTLFTGIGAAQAQTTWLPGTPTGTQPYFLVKFVGAPGANLAQCGSGAAYPILYGSQGAEAGTWTRPIRMDMDGRSGGCYQQFGIYDPTGAVSGLVISVNFSGDLGQCKYQGLRTIPITSSYSSDWNTWSSNYLIDTDDRGGYCTQTFSLEGRSDVSLDIVFVDEGNNGQCQTPGSYSVVQGRPVTLTIDTDNDSGGCQQQFRLRLNTDGDGDGVSDFTDNCPFVQNANQANCDGDSLGDACDPSSGNYQAVDFRESCYIQSGYNLFTWDSIQYADVSSCNGGSFWQMTPGQTVFCGGADPQTCCEQWLPFSGCHLDANFCPF